MKNQAYARGPPRKAASFIQNFVTFITARVSRGRSREIVVSTTRQGKTCESVFKSLRKLI